MVTGAVNNALPVVLGRIITDTDDDKAIIVHNLSKAGKTWCQIFRLLTREKKRNLKAAVSVYRAIFQAILLYGSETWVLKDPSTLHKLEIFHRRCARFLTGEYIHPQENGEWIYPRTEDVFKKAELESIENYIKTTSSGGQALIPQEQSTDRYCIFL
jgi:hypothetical protein